MNTSFLYYVFCILALVAGVFLVKKITGCLIKSVVMLVLMAVLAAAYFWFVK